MRPQERRRGRAGQRGAREDDNSRWLTTYGDAVTLLMAFFVMLYAMSQIDQVKFEAFLRGLAVPFGNPAVQELTLESSTGIVGDASPDGVTDVRPEPVRIHEFHRPEPESDDAPQPAEERTRELSLQDLAQLRAVREALAASLAEADLDHVAEQRITERGLVVSIATDNVLFETGSTRISPLGRRIVGAIARPLARYPNDVLVEGHTDDVPLRREDYTNWNLSTDRAVAVLTLMSTDFGISETRLGAVGYGEFRPRAPNTSAAGRARNRRVDVLVVAQGV